MLLAIPSLTLSDSVEYIRRRGSPGSPMVARGDADTVSSESEHELLERSDSRSLLESSQMSLPALPTRPRIHRRVPPEVNVCLYHSLPLRCVLIFFLL